MGDDDEVVRHGSAGGGLVVHSLVFIAVNLVLIGIWGLFVAGAEFAQVPDLLAHPNRARDANFFPVYVMVLWGAGLLVHAGVFATGIPRRRRKRRERARRARQRRKLQARVVGALGDGVFADAAVAGIKIVDGDKAARHVRREAAKAKDSRLDRRRTTPSANRERELPGSRAATRSIRAAPEQFPVDDLGTSDHDRSDARPQYGRRSSDRDATRHWMAVMFTDIVDSTPLTEYYGDDEWAHVLGEHRSLVRRCIADHRGIEVGTQGDSFLVRFVTPDDAAGAAIALQRDLADARDNAGKNDDRTPHVRIGIHAGEVVQNDDDLVGRVINVAARVTSAAEADEILVTEPLADHLSDGQPLVDRGLKTLKGFDRPRHLLALAWRSPSEAVDLRD